MGYFHNSEGDDVEEQCYLDIFKNAYDILVVIRRPFYLKLKVHTQ